MSPVKLRGFDGSMQYITLKTNDATSKEAFSLQAFISAVSRCSLIHNVYEVIAEGEQYEKLSIFAMENGGFKDMYVGEENQNDTWAVRVRHFGDEAGSKKERRHGARTRSLTMEKEALIALKPLLLEFGGGVDLKDPDCKIYVMDGLGAEEKRKVLARKIASGRKVSFDSNVQTHECLCRPVCISPVSIFHDRYPRLHHPRGYVSLRLPSNRLQRFLYVI